MVQEDMEQKDFLDLCFAQVIACSRSKVFLSISFWVNSSVPLVVNAPKSRLSYKSHKIFTLDSLICITHCDLNIFAI